MLLYAIGFALLLVFPTMVLAQVVDPSPDAWIPLAQALLDAVMNGQLWAAVAAGIGLLGFLLRYHGPKLWAPLGYLPVVVGIQFVFTFAGGMVNHLVAGADITSEMVWTALRIAGAAAGGFGVIEAIFKWFRDRKAAK